MLPTLLTGICGAAGGAWRRRGSVGVLPGAVLSMSGYWAVRGIPALWNAEANAVTIVFFLVLGYAAARLAGARRTRWLDLPFDLRLVFALIGGFVLRGACALAAAFVPLRRVSPWLLRPLL